MFLRRLIPFFLILFLVVSCKRKKATLSGEDPVEFGDFAASFADLKPPYQFTDTLLTRKEKDAGLISYKVFTQFVPDSVMRKLFGKAVKPKIYPLGKIKGANEQYLLAKFILPNKKLAAVICFDKKDAYAGQMTMMQLDGAASTRQLAGFDRGGTFYKSVQRRNPDGSMSEGKDAYLFNSDSKKFMLIMEEQLDENAVEVVNPIDTLPHKNKYSSDYGPDKKNLVSIRDHGKDAKKFLFFVHISRNRNSCIGELKGEAVFTSPNTAVYRLPGDPCVLEFIFSGGAVTLKEQEGCGSRRDVNCSFDGSYTRRRMTVAKKAAASKK